MFFLFNGNLTNFKKKKKKKKKKQQSSIIQQISILETFYYRENVQKQVSFFVAKSKE